jgi:hypothetical protein
MIQPLPVRNRVFASSPTRQRRPIAVFTGALPAISLLVIALGIAAPSPACAEADYVPLLVALADSETIAIARVVELPRGVSFREGHPPIKATLDVLRILKGNLKLGKQEVRLEDDPLVKPVGEIIVFFDKNRVWKFTAAPWPHRRIESDVLSIWGCLVDDPTYVFPGVITFEQLKTYLKDGTLCYSIEGAIWFPQRLNPSWKASAIRLKLTYDVINKQVHVTGLPKGVGIPSEPKIATIWEDGRVPLEISADGQIPLEYSDNFDRPLKLQGRIETLDPKSGSMLARFQVAEPSVLDAETLQKYLGDARLGHCYHKLRLRCTAHQQYPKLKDPVLTIDPSFSFKTLEGWDGGSLKVIATAYGGQPFHKDWDSPEIPADIRNAFAVDWVMRLLVPTNANQYLLLGVDNAQFLKQNLLHSIYSAPTRGAVEFYDGKAWHRVTTFTAELEPAKFAVRP